MPYQLSPTVIEAEITVTTTWPGATPYEIEREIIEEQEKVLKGIPDLVEMESSSYNSQGTVTLKFGVGTEVNNALLRVSNKLDEVAVYPENVKKTHHQRYRRRHFSRHLDGVENHKGQQPFQLYLPHLF